MDFGRASKGNQAAGYAPSGALGRLLVAAVVAFAVLAAAIWAPPAGAGGELSSAAPATAAADDDRFPERFEGTVTMNYQHEVDSENSVEGRTHHSKDTLSVAAELTLTRVAGSGDKPYDYASSGELDWVSTASQSTSEPDYNESCSADGADKDPIAAGGFDQHWVNLGYSWSSGGDLGPGSAYGVFASAKDFELSGECTSSDVGTLPWNPSNSVPRLFPAEHFECRPSNLNYVVQGDGSLAGARQCSDTDTVMRGDNENTYTTTVNWAWELHPPTPPRGDDPPGGEEGPVGSAERKGKAKAGKPIKLAVSSDEPGQVVAKGTQKQTKSGKGKRAARATVVQVAGKRAKKKITVKLKPARKQLSAGQESTLKLKPKGKKNKRLAKKLKRKVSKGATAKAKIKVIFSDEAGNTSREKLSFKLK